MTDLAPTPPTVLVVDDHADIRSTTSLLLQTCGFGVWEAGSGREALRRAKDRPDLVVLDVGLPDLDGRDVCRILKADPATAPTPVLMLSGYAVSPADRARGLDGGADAYLVKPADPEVLVAQARALVRAHRAELAARAGERRFRALIEKSYDAILLLAADATVTYASSGVARVGGRTPAELLGRAIFELVHPDELAAARARFAALLAAPTGTSVTEVYRSLHKDGTWRWIEATGTNLLADPDVGAVVANFHDVTDRRRMEEQLRQAAKMEAIGRLAGGVAHDFNNLLTVITGYGDLALTALPADQPVREMVAEMVHAGQRAAGVTQGLLAFSRKQVITPSVLDLNDVVRGLKPMLGRLLGADVRLSTALQPGLACVKADAGQMAQVVMNLCVNARDAMPRGGDLTVVTRDIPAGAGRPGPHVLLSVADAGEGMTAEVRARIFEPFFTTKGVGKGTGLGLATVHGIVEQAGGYIEVDSEPGRGTTFRIYLPRADESVLRSDGPPKSAAPRGSETVLLVEDEAAVRALVRRVLQSHGYRVLEAADGADAEAVAAGHRGPIELLVTDVVMPGRSGREVAEGLVGRRPALKVLFMSGYTDDDVMRHGVEADRVHFIQKPFSTAALARKVREVLDGSGSRAG